MSAPTSARPSAAERAYGLLRAYPAGFRAAYGREMALVFRDQRRAVGASGVRCWRFWAAMVWDVARSAPALRLDAWRARWERNTQAGEGNMKPMAILAVLIGAFEAVNALAEASAGGMVHRDGSWLVGVALAVVAGALLAAAGIALLRRAPGEAAWARGAAITCLVAVVFTRLVQPWMSTFAILLGVGFPIALLFFLRRGRGPSVPMTA